MGWDRPGVAFTGYIAHLAGAHGRMDANPPLYPERKPKRKRLESLARYGKRLRKNTYQLLHLSFQKSNIFLTGRGILFDGVPPTALPPHTLLAR